MSDHPLPHLVISYDYPKSNRSRLNSENVEENDQK